MNRLAAAQFTLLLLIVCPPAAADWVNLTGAQSAPNIAEYHVETDHVRVVLEIYVQDMGTLIDLLPDELLKESGLNPPPLETRIQRFAVETLPNMADGEVALPARIELVEPRMRTERPNPYAGKINPYTGQPIPGPPEDKRVLYAELVYPVAGRPQTLTFIPPRAERRQAAVAMGFIVYHLGVPVLDYRYLSEPARLTLDWDDPWYSRFQNRQFKRWQQSGMLTYLYVEPFEVRHETLVRVKDLEAWMDLGLEDQAYIEIDDFEPLRAKIGEFLLKHSNVTVDGRALKPILDRTNFVKRTMTRTYFITQPERIPINTAMIGVIITYLTEQIPQQVEVKWDLFSPRIQKVPTSAIDPAGPFPSYVTPEDNVLVWNNYLKSYQMPTVTQIAVDQTLTHIKLPLVSVGCLLALLPILFLAYRHRHHRPSFSKYVMIALALTGGSIALVDTLPVAVARPAALAPALSPNQATMVLENLLRNIYRSFDFRAEEDVYQRLATSVSGDLLAEIYLQNRKSLAITQAGGAQARVKEVKILDVTVAPPDNHPLELQFDTQLTAEGTVGHWGHIHTRKNQYHARITVNPDAGAWKITGMDIIDEKRIDPYAAIQGAQPNQ